MHTVVTRFHDRHRRSPPGFGAEDTTGRALHGHRTLDLHAMNHARLVGMIVHRVVHQTAVVPHHEIARAPSVSCLELEPRRVTEQILEQRCALLPRPSDEASGKRATNVQRTAPGLVVYAHDGML